MNPWQKKQWWDKEETGKWKEVPKNKKYYKEELVLSEPEMAGENARDT